MSILRSLSLRPQIVLADEPTASVDETMADIIVGQFKAMAAELGTTVLMVSHDIDLVTRVADQVFTLKPTAIHANHTYSELH